MIKEIARKILTQKQRQEIWKIRCRVSDSMTRINRRILNVLPLSMRVGLKSNLNITRRMDYIQDDIFLDVSSPIEQRVRSFSCRKEPETIEWIEKNFKEKDVFFDIGSNVGAYSLVAAKYFKGQVKIYAFEPSFLNFAQLNKNIFINECQGVIIPFNIALSSKTTIDNFNYQNLETGGALHTFGAALDCNHQSFQPVFSQPIISYTLDDFINVFALPKPNHIKLDVDGIELKILEGAEEALSDPCVRSILVEIGAHDQNIIDFLTRKGFQVQSRPSQGLEKMKMYNYIFSRAWR